MSKLVTIATFTSPWEAHIAKGRLEVDDIPTFIAHEHHISAAWFLSNALGGVKLQVPEAYADAAQEIMKSHIDGEYEEALKQEFVDLEQNICPRCKSKEYKSRFSYGMLLLVILTLGLSSVIFSVRKEIHICKICGKKWKN